MYYNQQTREHINRILEKNHHAYEVFRQAARLTEDQKLHKFLKDQSIKRAEFGLELARAVRSLGGEEEFMIDISSGWQKLYHQLHTLGESQLLKACIEGERDEANECNRILEMDSIPGSIQKLIKQHRDAVEETLDEVLAMELISEHQGAHRVN